MKELKCLGLIVMMSLVVSVSACDARESTKSAGDSQPTLQESATALDKKSRQTIGVGLAAIAMLFQSGAGSYLLEDGLSKVERDGIQELVSAGYATANSVQDPEGEMIHLAPTEKGTAILHALGKAQL